MKLALLIVAAINDAITSSPLNIVTPHSASARLVLSNAEYFLDQTSHKLIR
jgi:hypothetical protein